MLEAGHDLIFSYDERKTKDFCAQRANFLIIKRKLECFAESSIGCLVILWFYGTHTTHTCLISEFEFFCAVCSAQVLCIFLVPAWILGESNCHQFSWHWALIGSFHFPPYWSDIWLVFRPYLGIRIESFNNVCWPIKKVCWPTRNQLLCFCSLSGWKLQILTMLFANWLPQIYHALPFLFGNIQSKCPYLVDNFGDPRQTTSLTATSPHLNNWYLQCWHREKAWSFHKLWSKVNISLFFSNIQGTGRKLCVTCVRRISARAF